jgi:putative transposase
MRVEESLSTLKMAIKNRNNPTLPLIHHSDRGVQFCSNEYLNPLVKNNIKIILTQQYTPYENAITERIIVYQKTNLKSLTVL